MKRHLPLLCIVLTLLVLLPDMAWAQNGGNRRGGNNGNGRRGNTNRPAATPAVAAATPTATPTPTPAPAPGVIVGLANGLITVSKGNPPVASAYKVTVYSVVTLNGQTVQFASLKVGMQVVIKPASDVSYAETITAVDAAPPAPPPVEPVPAPAVVAAPTPPAAAAPAATPLAGMPPQ